MAMLKDMFKEHGKTFLITTFIAIITVFSDSFAGRIRFELNRADIRSTHYQEIAENFSSFIFETENIAEFYSNGWTTKTTLVPLSESYNKAIVELRRNEFTMLSLLKKFWDKSHREEFIEIMALVKQIDHQVHLLTPYTVEVINEKAESVPLEKSKVVTDELNRLIGIFRTKTEKFLTVLS